MPYEARVILDWMPHIYDRPGRIARILTGDNDEATPVMLNAPFVKGQDGQPQLVPPTTPGAQHFRLTPDAHYGVTISVGKSQPTRRKEGTDMMGQLAQAVPNMVPLFADLWVGMMDFPGHREIADRFKKMLPPQLQEGEQSQDPAALQAQLQQAHMQIQQLQPLANDNQTKLQIAQINADIETKKLGQKQQDSQLEAQTKGAKIQSDESIAHLKAAMEAEVAQLKAQLEGFKAMLQAHSDERDRALTAAGHVADLHQQATLAHTAHTHELQMADHEVANRPPEPAKTDA
jgi:hypothetical protein